MLCSFDESEKPEVRVKGTARSITNAMVREDFLVRGRRRFFTNYALMATPGGRFFEQGRKKSSGVKRVIAGEMGLRIKCRRETTSINMKRRLEKARREREREGGKKEGEKMNPFLFLGLRAYFTPGIIMAETKESVRSDDVVKLRAHFIREVSGRFLKVGKLFKCLFAGQKGKTAQQHGAAQVRGSKETEGDAERVEQVKELLDTE